MAELGFEEACRHADLRGISPHIMGMIREELPFYIWIDDHPEDREDQYLFVNEKPGRRRFVFCDGCGGHWEEKQRGKWEHEYRQNQVISCPYCLRDVVAKHMGRGFAGLRNTLNVVWYERSRLDPDAIVGYGAHCWMDYGEANEAAPWTLEPEVSVRALAVFRYGQGAQRWQKRIEWYGDYTWVEIKRVGSMHFGEGMFGWYATPRAMLVQSLNEAIFGADENDGTPFARAWSDEYLMLDQGQDATEALTMISKYPCVEYLTKLGLTDFLRYWLRDCLPPRMINWRGKDMAGVLRLSRQRLGDLKASGYDLTPELAAILQYADKNGIRCSIQTAVALENTIRYMDKHMTDRLAAALAFHQPSRRAKALKYMAKICGRHNQMGFSDFRDYWSECHRLGTNLNDDAVAFPKDFGEAHRRTHERLRMIEDAENRKKKESTYARWADLIEEHYAALEKKFGFRFGGLELRPAANPAEVVREGETLHHCVAGYVGRYAEGKTVICVLRRSVEPDTPWRTVELTPEGTLVQDRGYRNDMHAGIPMDEHYRAALDLFWEAWRERSKTA